MDNKFTVDAEKIRRDKKLLKVAKLVVVVLLLAIIFSYLIIGFVYNSGNFTITLDENLYHERGLIIYDDPYYKVFRSELYADTIDVFDNVTESWLPNDLHESDGGSHNGDNYIAYTFFIENIGDKLTEYHSEIIIEDVIKNVDEAVRIKVYKNDEPIVYAKQASSGEPEPDTTAFVSDKLVAADHVVDFKPGDITKYTIVVWLEGKDPDCTNNIIGGEIKMHMQFNSEFIEK